MAFIKRGNNKKLIMTPKSSRNVKQIDECFKICALDSNCKSFDYHKSKR